MDTCADPGFPAQGSKPGAGRQLAAVLMAGLLAACGADDTERGQEGFVKGFFGAVAADEPRAALLGRKILTAGGSAADAATAMYFTLAVTLPSAASLGGGGTCLVYDNRTHKVMALNFLTRTPDIVPPTATRPSAVPGNPLGFFALHSRYGRLRWAQMISPAEQLARFGTQVSKSLNRRLKPVAAALLEDPDSRAVFQRTDGKVVTEGDFFQQRNLAATLSTLRSRGPGYFYRGRFAKILVDAVATVGGSLSEADLRAYKPVWEKTISVELGNDTAHFSPPPAAAGVIEAQMLAMLEDDDRFEDADEVERLHLLSEAGLASFADRSGWLRADDTSALPPEKLVARERLEGLFANYQPARHRRPDLLRPAPVARSENPSATSLVVVDPDGMAVACALTMNNNFGIGRFARGTGILLAAAPTGPGRGPLSLGPMIMVNHNSGKFLFAGAAAGGAAAPTALMNVAARVILAEEKLDRAMARARIHHGGAPDITYHEPNMPTDLLRALGAKGHRLTPTPILGGVNAIHCPEGLPITPDSCAVRTDPRGSGLALIASE